MCLVIRHLAEEFNVCHCDFVAALWSILELDNALGAVNAEQEAHGALVVAVNNHHFVALLRQHRLQIVQRNIYCLVQIFQM